MATKRKRKKDQRERCPHGNRITPGNDGPCGCRVSDASPPRTEAERRAQLAAFEPPKVTPVGNMHDLLQTVCGPEPTVEALQHAGIISSDPNAKRARPAGSSPALRIACPSCGALPGAYCMKTELVRAGGVLAGSRQVQQTIAHKKRREEEERTR